MAIGHQVDHIRPAIGQFLMRRPIFIPAAERRSRTVYSLCQTAARRPDDALLLVDDRYVRSGLRLVS